MAKKYLMSYKSCFSDFNEKLEEKVRWELLKDVVCCCEQILEAVPFKTVAVQPLTSHHTYHPSKTCWILLEKKGWTDKWHSPLDSLVLVAQQNLTFINSM